MRKMSIIGNGGKSSEFGVLSSEPKAKKLALILTRNYLPGRSRFGEGRRTNNFDLVYEKIGGHL